MNEYPREVHERFTAEILSGAEKDVLVKLLVKFYYLFRHVEDISSLFRAYMALHKELDTLINSLMSVREKQLEEYIKSANLELDE